MAAGVSKHAHSVRQCESQDVLREVLVLADQPNMYFEIIDNVLKDTQGLGIVIDGLTGNSTLSMGHVVRGNTVIGSKRRSNPHRSLSCRGTTYMYAFEFNLLKNRTIFWPILDFFFTECYDLSVVLHLRSGKAIPNLKRIVLTERLRVGAEKAPPTEYGNALGAINVGQPPGVHTSQHFGNCLTCIRGTVVEDNRVQLRRSENGTCESNGVVVYAAFSVERGNTCEMVP